MIQFGTITDIHWGPDEGTRAGSQAPNLVTEIVNSYNAFDALDFVVELGDRIGNVDRDHDLKHLCELSKVIKKLNVRYYPLLGNHDVRNLTPEENEEVLNSQVGFRTIKVKDIELIFLNAQDPTRGGLGGNIGKDQLKALQKALLSDKRPALVFTHQPLDEQDVSNNIYFEEWKRGNYAYVESRKEVRALLERSGRVKAVFQGHTHWNRLEHHAGIPYFTQASVTETGNIPSNQAGAYYSIVRLGREGLKMMIRGQFPVRFELSSAELGGRIDN